MKKILMILMCAFTLSACGASGKGGAIEYVSIDAVIEKLNQKESFILLVSKESCTHCKDLEAMLDKTLDEHDITIYNIKLNESSEDAYDADISKLEEYLDKPGRTPHTYYIDKGVVIDEYVGYSEGQDKEYWNWVKQSGLENIQ